jgi:HNH endonuclease
MPLVNWKDKPCRLWHRALNSEGYGVTYVGGRQVRVHRKSWEDSYGPIPDGLFVCHHCDVRACYEPTHLFLGTNSDSMRDARDKGRLHPFRFAPGKSPNAKLSWPIVREIRATIHAAKTGHPGQGDPFSILAASRRYGVGQSVIRSVVQGKTWREEGI